MRENSIRRAVREGRAALGTGLKEFASRGVPRIIELSGFDYCMIDMEHGAFDLETIADLAGGSAAENAEMITRLLNGETGARRDIVLLNAGAALLVAGAAPSLSYAIAVARNSIDSGAARNALNTMKEICG